MGHMFEFCLPTKSTSVPTGPELSAEQNAALEKAGTALVLSMLLANMPGAGSDAPAAGLQCSKPPVEADIENLLAGRIAQDRKQQTWTLRWAAIAGVGAIIGALLAAFTLWR
jgi:hypothetical protein